MMVIDTPSPSTTLIRPSTYYLHYNYVFYIRATISGISGGDKTFFGPYYLGVGCTSASLVITDSVNLLLTGVHMWVGDPRFGVYTL